MNSFSKTNFFVFIGVAAAHATLIGGLSCVKATPDLSPENLIFIEILSESVEVTPEKEQEIQPVVVSELPAPDNEETLPETAEIVPAEIPALAPLPSPEKTNYILEAAHDSASGKDGEVRGDGLNAAEKIIETPPANSEAPQETPQKEISFSQNLPAATSPVETNDSAGEKIGKQGLPDAAREGEFGNNGAGGDSATATVRYRRKVAPKYPRADRIAGRSGTVVLLLEIDADGKLTGVRIKHSSGFRSLDAAAIQAARASKYLPAHNGERHVSSLAEASYTFSR